MAANPHVRRSAEALSDDDRPLALPHLETDDAGLRFLGEPVDPDLLVPGQLELWRQCAGDRPLASWPTADREVITRWHAAGLLVAVGARVTETAGRTAERTVVSPHPDDAQLALGGLLAELGGKVVDVFTEETWTRRPYYAGRPELTGALLLAEERVACAVLGVECELLGHVDGAARDAWSTGFFVADPAGDRPQDVEPELFDKLVSDLAAAVPPAGPVFVPLAVGGHVDHVLCREAVLALVAAGTVAAQRIVFYEDMPYSVFADPTTLAEALGHRLGGPLRPELVPSASEGVKREALWSYRLQTTEGMIGRVIRYGRRLTGGTDFAERIWLGRDIA